MNQGIKMRRYRKLCIPIIAVLLILNANHNIQRNKNKPKIFISREKAFEACEKWANALNDKNPNYDLKTKNGYKLYDPWCLEKEEGLILGDIDEYKSVKSMGNNTIHYKNPTYKSTREYQQCVSKASKYQQRYGKYKIEKGKKIKDTTAPWFLCVQDKRKKLSVEKRRSRVVKKFTYKFNSINDLLN